MDVVLLSGELGAGGAPRVCYQVAKHLPAEIELTMAYLGGRDELTEKFEEIDVPVIRLADKPLSAEAVQSFRELLQSRDPDLIHTHMMAGGLIGRPLAALYDIPVVHTVHTNYETRPVTAQVPDVLPAPFGDCAVCVSESVQQSLPWYYRSETTVVHNCIDVEETRQEGASTWEELDWTTELERDAPLVVSVARYDPKKRRRDLVEAFRFVADEHPKAQLVLTGKKCERQARLADRAEALGIVENVHFVGFVDNPQTVYNQSDIAVFSSESEGFSIGMLEAMAHGNPIVATDIPAFVEALGDEYSGYVTVSNPAELGTSLSEIIGSSKRRADLERTISKRISEFSGEKAALAYEEIYSHYLPRKH